MGRGSSSGRHLLILGVHVHRKRLLSKLKSLHLERIFVILLIILIDPKDSKAALGIDSEDKVEMVVE